MLYISWSMTCPRPIQWRHSKAYVFHLTGRSFKNTKVFIFPRIFNNKKALFYEFFLWRKLVKLFVCRYCSSNVTAYLASPLLQNYGPNLTLIFIPGTLNCSNTSRQPAPPTFRYLYTVAIIPNPVSKFKLYIYTSKTGQDFL